MSNPTNNFSSDLDPYDRLAQMLDGGLFKLLPLPPSWANYVRAGYAADPSLLSAPAPAIPGFRKLPDLIETPAQPPIDSGPPSFDPLPTTPLGASNTPGFDKSPAISDALAAADPRPPGFYRSPALFGLRAFLPGRDPDPTSALGPQMPPFGGSGFPSVPQLLPASLPTTVPRGPGPMGPSTSAGDDPYLIPVRENPAPTGQPQQTAPSPSQSPRMSTVAPPMPSDTVWQATKDAASAVNNGVNWTANYIQTVLAGALADTIGLPHTAGTAVDLLSKVTGLPFNDAVLMRPLMTIARALPSSEQASRELFEMVRTFDPDFQVKSTHPILDAGLRGLLGGAMNKGLGAAISLSGAANPTMDLGTAAKQFGQRAGFEALKEVWPLLDQQTRDAVQRQLFFTANPPMQVPIGQPQAPVTGPGGGLGGPNWYIPPPNGR